VYLVREWKNRLQPQEFWEAKPLKLKTVSCFRWAHQAKTAFLMYTLSIFTDHPRRVAVRVISRKIEED
jgi:hypothetical protein